MMKSYRRYEPGKALGVISSVQCNVVYDWSGNMAISGSGDSVSVWNVRQGSLVSTLQNDNPGYPYTTTGEVSYVARSPDKVAVAAGYSSGEVCIFQYLKSSSRVGALRGHQSGISSLAYDASGTLLASGGRDSDIVIWDTVSLSGVCRLRGHKDAITGLAFLSVGGAAGSVGSRQLLISTSKDTLMKVWDLGTQHCLQTIVGHRCEIWALAVFSPPSSSTTAEAAKKAGKNGSSASGSAETATPSPSSAEVSSAASHCRIVTGASDDLLRAYHVRIPADASLIADNEDVLEYTGCIKLNGERCTHVEFNHDGTLLAALVGKKDVEVFRVRSEAEAKKKLKRRQKRAREQTNKQMLKGTEDADNEGGESNDAGAVKAAVDESIVLTDCLDMLTTIHASHKVASISICPHSKAAEEEQVLLSMINNAMEVFSVRTAAAEGEALNAKKCVIEMQGHRSDVRAIAVSTDGLHIATCSSDGAKLWSTVSFQCIRSCNTGYGVSIVFAPGNRFIVVGTREGQLQVVDCSSGDLVSSTEAHQGALWSLSVHPDGKSLVSGGADHIVRFWDFGVKDGALALTNAREIDMIQDVLCCRFSPSKSEDKSLVAVGLLDSTIKIFYTNTMKFYLSLYGHKLSVMCIDISYDGNILISGSADKTIKIWGLDFGDCHRSLLGHEDSVTSVRFQAGTHYIFSSSKDGCVKYWDADRFEQILNLPGHFSCVWGLDVSFDGAFCVSCSQDRSIRLWNRSEDLVFIEEERDRAFEAQADQSAAKTADVAGGDGDLPFAPVGAVQTVDTIKSGERLIESIDLVEIELAELTEQGHPDGKSSNPLLLNMSPMSYLVHILKSIRSSDLEQALLVLPFHTVVRLVRLFCKLCQRGTDVELVGKSLLFLFRAHQPRLMSTQTLAQELATIATLLRDNLSSYRLSVGTNLAALRFVQRVTEERRQGQSSFQTDVLEAPIAGEGKQKGKRSKGAAKAGDKRPKL